MFLLVEASQYFGHRRDLQQEFQQNSSESFEFTRSRKDFLDEAALLEYVGKNMLFIIFKNQIVNLIYKCPYDDKNCPC